MENLKKKKFFENFNFILPSGKDCKDETRPHQTRCDMYYKCVVLPSSKNIAWVPTNCKRGLIYDSNLKICVLPGIECSRQFVGFFLCVGVIRPVKMELLFDLLCCVKPKHHFAVYFKL